MRTKSEVNRLRDLGIATEIFTHSELGSFNITLLRKYIGGWNNPLRLQPLIPIYKSFFHEVMAPECKQGKEAVDWLISQREIDEARVASLTAAEIEEPLINVVTPKGTSVIVDGMHRFTRRYRNDMKWFLCLTVPLKACPMLNPNDPQWLDLNWGEKEVVDGQLKKVR